MYSSSTMRLHLSAFFMVLIFGHQLCLFHLVVGLNVADEAHLLILKIENETRSDYESDSSKKVHQSTISQTTDVKTRESNVQRKVEEVKPEFKEHGRLGQTEKNSNQAQISFNQALRNDNQGQGCPNQAQTQMQKSQHLLRAHLHQVQENSIPAQVKNNRIPENSSQENGDSTLAQRNPNQVALGKIFKKLESKVLENVQETKSCSKRESLLQGNLNQAHGSFNQIQRNLSEAKRRLSQARLTGVVKGHESDMVGENTKKGEHQADESSNQSLSIRAINKSDRKNQKNAETSGNQAVESPNQVKKKGIFRNLISTLSVCSKRRTDGLEPWKQLEARCKKCGRNKQCKKAVKNRAKELCKHTQNQEVIATKRTVNALAMQPLPPERRAGPRPGTSEIRGYEYPPIPQGMAPPPPPPRTHYPAPPPSQPPRKQGGGGFCCCFCCEVDGDDPGCCDDDCCESGCLGGLFECLCDECGDCGDFDVDF